MKIYKNWPMSFLWLIFFFAGCGLAKPQEKFLTVTPKIVTEKPLFTVSGFLELKKYWPFYAWTQGQVQNIFSGPGDPVQKKAIILKIFNPELKKNLRELRREIEILEKEISLNQQLFKEGVSETGQTETQIKKLAELKISEKDLLDKLEVKSPQSGVLAFLNTELFHWTEPGSLLGYVFPAGPAKPEFYLVKTLVPEHQLKNIWGSQTVLVKGENISDLKGEVVWAAPFLSEENKFNGISVICRIFRAPPKYFLKMPVEITFYDTSSPGLAIPRIALFKKNGGSWLYLLKNNRPRKLRIDNFREGDEFIYLARDKKLAGQKIILNIDDHQYAFGN